MTGASPLDRTAARKSASAGLDAVQTALSFEQAPPVSVPFRFFLTAPWFGVAAGLLLVWQGEHAVLSRWTPATLALTHLMVLGLMMQAMAGALFQFIPVAAGGNVWRPRMVATAVHPLLIVGTVGLVVAFLVGHGAMFRVAAFLLASGACILAGIVLWALVRTPAQGPTIGALRLAVTGLMVTVGLGATLAEGFAASHDWPLMPLANLHAAWGLGGWALMLVVAVSYFVVPMFQLTPPYPQRLARAFPLVLLAVVAAWTLGFADPDVVAASWVSGLIVAAAFAVVTLRLQSQRRRKVTDPTLWCFRFAMICLLAISISGVTFEFVPALGEHPRTAWWLGALAIVGVFASAINGMLYKIVPFLCWLHLQREAPPGILPPSAREMISGKAMARQAKTHFCAVALMAIAAIEPVVAPLAGAAFALSQTWLGWNLVGAMRVFARFRDQMRAGGPRR